MRSRPAGSGGSEKAEEEAPLLGMMDIEENRQAGRDRAGTVCGQTNRHGKGHGEQVSGDRRRQATGNEQWRQADKNDKKNRNDRRQGQARQATTHSGSLRARSRQTWHLEGLSGTLNS